jgi:hypothetical protein
MGGEGARETETAVGGRLAQRESSEHSRYTPTGSGAQRQRQSQGQGWEQQEGAAASNTEEVLPVLWRFFLLDGGGLGDEGGDEERGQDEDKDKDEEVLSVLTSALSRGGGEWLLRRFGVFLTVRLVGLLISQATKESCTSASLDTGQSAAGGAAGCGAGAAAGAAGAAAGVGSSDSEDDERGGGGGGSGPSVLLARCLDYERSSGFTRHLCSALSALIAPRSTGGRDSSRGGGSMGGGGNWLGTSASLWLLLTFLEGSCFRHPLNQVRTCCVCVCIYVCVSVCVCLCVSLSYDYLFT